MWIIPKKNPSKSPIFRFRGFSAPILRNFFCFATWFYVKKGRNPPKIPLDTLFFTHFYIYIICVGSKFSHKILISAPIFCFCTTSSLADIGCVSQLLGLGALFYASQLLGLGTHFSRIAECWSWRPVLCFAVARSWHPVLCFAVGWSWRPLRGELPSVCEAEG